MIQKYIGQLQSRTATLVDLIGDQSQYESSSKASKQAFQQLIAKKVLTNKEVGRKYQRLVNHVEKYGECLDYMGTADKINIVVDELQTLQEMSQILTRIQKNSVAIDTKQYNKNLGLYTQNINLLDTQSRLALKPETGKMQLVSYNPQPLTELLSQQRKEMNALMQLNYRIVNNLNEKIRMAYARKTGKAK